MMTLRQLVAAAIEKRGFTSERQLSIAMGLSPSVVNQWLRGISLPTERHVTHLADMIGMQAGDALILLMIWRSKEHRSEADLTIQWTNVLRRLNPTLVAIALVMPLVQSVSYLASSLLGLYIMRY
jgi:transcriptional regulator with XRE-family HTH domain